MHFQGSELNLELSTTHSKLIDLKAERESKAITVGNFNMLLSTMDRSDY